VFVRWPGLSMMFDFGAFSYPSRELPDHSG
jgi:hypothetical protein